jgi:Arc/MetJ-type ribon-helix-helix transcriptional regulator
MDGKRKDTDAVKGKVWPMIEQKLREMGIDLERICCAGDVEGGRLKVVCVAPDLSESVQEMGQAPRGQTVMVRLDEETVRKLDAWVETGYVKSRSEAAALFIREGLKVRASELEELTEALDAVRKARERLRKRAREVFGEDSPADQN